MCSVSKGNCPGGIAEKDGRSIGIHMNQEKRIVRDKSRPEKKSKMLKTETRRKESWIELPLPCETAANSHPAIGDDADVMSGVCGERRLGSLEIAPFGLEKGAGH
jgi:hypothetical protein